MSRRLLLAARGDAGHVALLEGGRLVEYIVDAPALRSRVGAVHLGRVRRVEHGLGAAFVDVGLAEPGFLPLTDAPNGISEGNPLPVQVVQDAREEKGVRLTARVSLPGALLVLTPARPGISLASRIADPAERQRLEAILRSLAAPGEGWILRSAAVGAAAEALSGEAARLRRAWAALEQHQASARAPALLLPAPSPLAALLRDVGGAVDEMLADSPIAAAMARRDLAELPAPVPPPVIARKPEWDDVWAEVEDQRAAALEERVELPSGGWLLFEPGRTLTAIDVNSGRQLGADARSRRGAGPGLRTNLEACPVIARQLRLRNLGGIIVIDFIDLPAPDQKRQVVDALKAALQEDREPCWVGPMSRLGLVEMTRRRRGLTLEESLRRTNISAQG